MNKRNSLLVIVAGAITTIAIVLAFASSYLGLSWLWLRPAAELILLAELVALVVLERHQLFEPVHQRVVGIDTQVSNIQISLDRLTEQLGSAGNVSLAVGAREVFRVRTRMMREALTREQQGPQIFRSALLSGAIVAQDPRDLGDELQAFLNTASDFFLLPGSPADSKGHRWSARLISACATLSAFDGVVEACRSLFAKVGVLNVDLKVLLRAQPEGLVSPAFISDQAVLLVYTAEDGPFRWGVALSGTHYVNLFSRWFDDRWSAIPDGNLIYSRDGLNQNAIDRTRREIGIAEPRSARQTA